MQPAPHKKLSIDKSWGAEPQESRIALIWIPEAPPRVLYGTSTNYSSARVIFHDRLSSGIRGHAEVLLQQKIYEVPRSRGTEKSHKRHKARLEAIQAVARDLAILKSLRCSL